MTRGLKLFPRIATYSTHHKQSPKLSGCGYSSVLSQEWGRTVLSPGRLLCFQHSLLDGWDLAFPIRALAQSAGRAVALPCRPAPQGRVPWQPQGKDCAPCPEFGCNNHERICTHFLYTLSSSQGSAHGDFCTAPYRKNVEGRLVPPRLVRSCHQKATFQNGRSE